MSAAEHWHQTAAVRLRDAPVRVLFSIMIAVAGELATKGALWPIGWLVVVNLAQLLTLAVLERVRRDPAYVVSRRREAAFFVSLAFSGAAFASSGALLWFEGGWDCRVMGVVVLAGGAVNVALQSGHSAKLLWTACAPFMFFLLTLPLSAAVTAPEGERGMMGIVAFACGLFVLHLGAAASRSIVTTRKLQQALQEAQQEHRRAEAASAAKSDFLGVMSHELRTPLNGILGMAQALENRELTCAQREGLEVIRHSGESLLVLLNDLLDLSNIETARLRLEAGVVDIAALAEQTETVFGPLARAKGVTFQLRRLKSAGARRAGDPTRVRQVLHNLIGNAIKFTEQGSVSVVIKGGADELVFEICSAGAGISDEKCAALFEQISGDDASVAPRHGGSCLGLGIARGLARLMGGDVTVSSKDGVGSTFVARMPLTAASAPRRSRAAPDRRSARTAEAADHSIRILAAEDNPTNQLVIKTLLGQMGLSVHIVADGQEALEAWRSAPWDLVLMDIRMPGMDGMAATKAIRTAEAAEGRARTPIIAVTANATAHQAADYMAVGMDGLAPKPIQLPQLLAVMSEALAASPAIASTANGTAGYAA